MPIVNDQIAAGTITGAKIQDGSLTGADLASATVTEDKIADLGKEGGSTLAANIKRRGEELSYDTLPTEGIVLGTGDELKVEPAASPDMTVRIQSANCGKVAYGADAARIVAGAGPLTATITTADATNPRYDLISLKPDGTLRVTAGTPDASPALPALPANDVLLCVVKIAASDTAIGSGDLFDHRRRAGHTPEQEEFTAAGGEASWHLAARVATSQAKAIEVYRNGLRLTYGATADMDHYTVSNAIERGGSTVTLGANANLSDKILVRYNR